MKSKIRSNSLVSILVQSENARDRERAIRKSWSPSEMKERRQVALDSQFRLASLIALGSRKSRRIDEVLEFASCC